MVIERLVLKEAQNVRSRTMTRVEERDKETSDCRRQVHRTDSQIRNQKSVTRQGQARQKKGVDFCVSVTRKVLAANTRLCDFWYPSFCVIHKKTQQIRYELFLRPCQQR